MNAQNSWLTKNPFFLLNVSGTDNRRRITAAADEMSFVLGPDDCSAAQSALLTPGKRLAAELDWFIDSDGPVVDLIRRSIDERKAIPVSDDMGPLSKLNALLYNLSFQTTTSHIELGFSFLSVDKRFSSINAAELTNRINQNRTSANLSSITEQDLSFELEKKRERIRLLLNDILSNLTDDDYVHLVNNLADYYVTESQHSDFMLLEDIINQYEIRMQSQIDSAAQQIETHIDRIKRLTNTEAYRSNIETLIARVKKWDALVQPLQQKSKASGMPHSASEDMGHKLRNLALFLNNEKNLTEEALMLTTAMLEVFSEIRTLADRFKEDSSALKNVLQENAAAKKFAEKFEELKKEADNIKAHVAYASEKSIDSFLEKVQEMDDIIASANLEPAMTTQLRETLCYLARDVAIHLHNKYGITDLAYRISQALLLRFGEIPSLKSKLSEDYQSLKRQNNAKNSQSGMARLIAASDKITPVKALIGIIAVVAIIIYVAINNSAPSSSPSRPSRPTTTTTTSTSTEYKFSSVSRTGTKVYADIESIFPEWGIYWEDSSTYHHFVCACETTSGTTIWVYITTADYKACFDSDASTSVYREYADEIPFYKARRIHGTVTTAESILTGLSSELGVDTVLSFSSVD